jgi:hypothetical protein
MERKLASIQKITNLEKIEGADKILCASVLGWKVVVGTVDNFKIGDLIVYCECDSIMPEKKEFEFLRERKFRIKTIKLRGQVSQGICFPIAILPAKYWRPEEGLDVTDIIGVKKYDPQAAYEQKEIERLNKINKNRLGKFFNRYKWYRNLFNKTGRIPFPAFIKKTDEDRIQLFPDICEREKDTIFEATEKIDGQSATYFILKNKKLSLIWKPFIFGVCSRNFQLVKEDNSSYWSVFRDYKIKRDIKYFFDILNAKDFIVLQGEIIGPKIQNNKYKLDKYKFYLFNVFRDNTENNLISIMSGISMVPYVKNMKLESTIQETVECAKGKSILSDIPREGLVLRNYEKNISFKVINPDFLLKYQDEEIEQ